MSVWPSRDIVGVGLPTIIGGEIACQPNNHLRITLISGGRHDGAGSKPIAKTDIVGPLVTCPYAVSDTAKEHREHADHRKALHRTVLIPEE
jgi:hypothetical protein